MPSVKAARSEQMLLDPLCDGGSFNLPFALVTLRLVPGDAFTLGEHSPVRARRIIERGGEIGHERGHCPFDTLDRAVQQAVDGVGQLPVGEGVSGDVDNLIHQRWIEQDAGGEPADVLRRGDRHGGVPTAQGAHGVPRQIDHAERGLLRLTDYR